MFEENLVNNEGDGSMSFKTRQFTPDFETPFVNDFIGKTN